MLNKQQIQNIKINIERTIQGLRTKRREFKYDDTGNFVKPDALYSIYYTLMKNERFLTGTLDSTSSRIITPTGKRSLFGQYSKIKKSTRTPYPKITQATPSDSDYRIGEITRYFTHSGNDKSKPVFEISKEDFDNQNSLYNYTNFQWRISGKKEEVIRDNSATIGSLQVDYPGINKVLFPLQLWKPPLNSSDDIEKKLSLLKKT